jgi:hypothetical protein
VSALFSDEDHAEARCEAMLAEGYDAVVIEEAC